MATIDATVGGADANAFVTIAACETYFDERLHVALWSAASADDKIRAVIMATRDISRLDFVGLRVTATQALSWPREYAPNPDTSGYDDQWYEDDIIPERVKYATMELALEYLRAGTADLATSDPNAGVIRKKVDVLETQWSETGRVTGWARYPIVMESLLPLVSGAANAWERA